MSTESSIEQKQRKRVKAEGGIYLKFLPQWFVGMTDRIVILPNATISFIEIKKEGKELTPRQVNRAKNLKKLGCTVYACIGDEQLTKAIDTEIRKSRGRSKKRAT